MMQKAMMRKALVPMKGKGWEPMVELWPQVDGAAVGFCAQLGSGYRGRYLSIFHWILGF